MRPSILAASAEGQYDSIMSLVIKRLCASLIYNQNRMQQPNNELVTMRPSILAASAKGQDDSITSLVH